MKDTQYFTILLILIFTTHAYRATEISTKDDSKDPQYFEHITKSRNFVDKTNLIKVFLQHERPSDAYNYAKDSETRAIAFTCPEGFGKTTNLDMIRRFFQLPYDKSTGQIIDKKTTHYYKLFTNQSLNLKIAKDPDFIKKHFGEYPTIHLDFSNIQGTTIDEIMNSTKKQIGRVLNSYRWLCIKARKENENSTDQRLQKHLNYFRKIFKKTANATDAANALEGLAEILSKNFNNTRIMVLIDNYDTPLLHTMKNNIDIKPMYDYMHFLLQKFVQYEKVPCHVMVVGTSSMPFLKWIHKDPFTNWWIDAIERNFFMRCPARLGQYFGFTSQEIDRLFITNNIENDERAKMKKHFNNYRFKFEDRSSIYHPIIVLQYFKKNYIEDNHLGSHLGLLLPQVMKCSCQQENYLTWIVEFLTRKHVDCMFSRPYFLSNCFKMNIVNKVIAQKQCSESEPLSQVFLYGVLFDNGCLGFVDEGTGIGIPNLSAENQLVQILNQFFLHSYGINTTNSYITDSIQAILNSNDTTDKMLVNLANSLQIMINPSRTSLPNEFQFKSLIFSTLINVGDFQEVTYLGVMTSFSRFDPTVDRFMLQNHHKKISLIVQLLYHETMEKAINTSTAITNYVPYEWPIHNRNFHWVKYLIINLDENNQVQAGQGKSRQFKNITMDR